MTKRIISATIIFACVCLIAGLIGHKFPVWGQTPAFNGAGSFHVTGTLPVSGTPFEAVFMTTRDGTIVSSVPALGCLTPGSSVNMAAGVWGTIGVTSITLNEFVMLSPIYNNGQSLGDIGLKGTWAVAPGTGPNGPVVLVSGKVILQIPAGAGCASDSGHAFNVSGTTIPGGGITPL